MRTQSKQRSVSKGISLHNNKMSQKSNELPLPKLTISLESKQYTLPINTASTIQKLALQLMLMIYDDLLQQQLTQQAKQIHAYICQILVKSVKQVIKEESNFKIKTFLSKMISQYQQKQINNSQNEKQSSTPNKYFVNNYFQTSSDYESQDNQSFSSNSASRVSFNLYEKGQKSIEKRRKLQKQNAQQKSKVQISYCTFHPNISKSQKKIKSKDNENVFNRLYTNADEIKIKNYFRRKQLEQKQEKINSSFKFVPQINPCSKQIMKIKQEQDQQDTSAFEDLNKSQVSFQASQNSSYKYLKDQSSKKVFQKLYDLSFYENRLNKTIQKITQDKQNQYSFHPQLSEGTKRLTKNLPNLQSRLQLYASKKAQNNQSGYFSKSKDMKKDASRSQIQHHKQQFNNSTKKGIKKMLAMAKNTQDQNLTYYKKVQQRSQNRINSEIFRLNKTQFFDDDYEFEITPKKLNIEPLAENFNIQNQQIKKRNNAQIQSEKINSSQQRSNIKEKQLQNKNKIFQKIFTFLSQGEQQLTVDKIRQNRSIPGEIIKILMPLIKQLAEMDTQLDEDEFVWSLQNLYEQINIEMKAILLSWGLTLFKENHNRNIKANNNNLKHVKTDGSVFELIQ